MTTASHTTRRTVLAALPLVGAAAVLPAGAAELDNPMEGMMRHARAIRNILQGPPYHGGLRATIDPAEGYWFGLEDTDGRPAIVVEERIGPA